MDAAPHDHEDRIRKLEQKVCDLACEVKLLREHIDTRSAELKGEIVQTVAQAVAQLNEKFDAHFERLEQNQRWIIGLVATCLLGIAGGLATVLARLA